MTTSKQCLGLLLAAWIGSYCSSAWAQPKFNICNDLGPSFGFGISDFGAAKYDLPNEQRYWYVAAAADYGIAWRYAYFYLAISKSTDLTAHSDWVRQKLALQQSVGATPMITWYQLLLLGQENNISGSEPEIVRQVLNSPALMKQYFTHVVWTLKLLKEIGGPVLMQIEPDTWGFMMWGFGVDGNADGTSIPVQVKGSGYADVSAFPNHAGGFGQALLALRDKYAPDVRMGWHVSNFRQGTRPDVAAGLYSSMGKWDVLVSEEPHNEANDNTWWEPWDETRVNTNLAWFNAVTKSAGIPMLLWQTSIGTMD